MKSGVVPFRVPLAASAPASQRCLTTSKWPLQEATIRGDVPSCISLSLSAPATLKKRTTWRCPFSAATKSGVAPLTVRLSLSAPYNIQVAILSGDEQWRRSISCCLRAAGTSTT
eukprot:gnl/TRDRNA2_/TRDRNA2_136767_c1_seq2.p3 gnl/TRDRNA2_/TRDRNA2_136767_c1~~gnl/TRDRNA2_/TRDRNA2_136767_c1_seq2.p3  ORF type:complete len:114 (+),score=8.91 gnl/TRDRNA2_/TRDRNA2_136767_c1_seq2:411-752(+)